MTRQHKIAYLEAMGIPVWVARRVPPVQPEAVNVIGSNPKLALCGNSDTGSSWLWVIAGADMQENQLLADIQRAAGDTGKTNMCHPVQTGGQKLGAILEEKLITRLILFGDQIDPGKAAKTGSCDIVRAPSLEALAKSPAMKKQLWKNLQQLLGYKQQ